MYQKAIHIAASIVKNLHMHGYQAFFVGGCVRDLLLNIPCDDIDIVTSATTDELLALYPKAIPIGAAFGIIQVIIDAHSFELATFRRDGTYLDGRHPSSVELNAGAEEDAKRRDFTINGMMYDPETTIIYDYVGGQNDLAIRCIRTIGSPKQRFTEDRLRLLRAIRFKNILQFSIDPSTWDALCEQSQYIDQSVSKERIWQELKKMHKKNVLKESLRDMLKSNLLSAIFPILQPVPVEKIQARIASIAHYEGNSLVAALCLLFQEESVSYLKIFDTLYHLSRNETQLIRLFLHYGFNLTNLSEIDCVEIYAHQFGNDYLHACAAITNTPKITYLFHMEKKEKLAFWVNQIKKHQFFVSANDLIPYKIGPGLSMGYFLKKAFILSLEHKCMDKQKIISMLLET